MRAFTYLFILSFFLISGPVSAWQIKKPLPLDSLNKNNQVEKPKKVKKKKEPKLALTGLRLSTDLFDYASTIYQGNLSQYQAMLELVKENQMFYNIRVGRTNKWSSDTAYQYNNTGYWFELGLEKNVLYEKMKENAVYIGAKASIISFQQEVLTTLSDDYWGDAVFDLKGPLQLASTITLYGGLKVKIKGPIYFGYSVGYQQKLFHTKALPLGDSYLPAFGSMNKTGRIRFGYHFYYHINLKK